MSVLLMINLLGIIDHLVVVATMVDAVKCAYPFSQAAYL